MKSPINLNNMNLDFIKKLIIGLAKGAAKDGLVDLIEKAEKSHPVVVSSFVGATAELIPVLKELAESTETKVDDEVVSFLNELIGQLETDKEAGK